MLNDFLYTVTLVCAFWGIMWTKKDALNLVVKLLFLGLAVWGALLSAMQLGFIIKP